MAEEQWGSRAQRWLLGYFRIQWLQRMNLVFYFVVEILLFAFLTVLPIKIVFNWLLVSFGDLYTILDCAVMVIFTAHIYLYLNYKLGKLVRNPEIQRKLLFQNKVIKLKWASLITPELVYDLLCLFISIYEVIQIENTIVARVLEIFYLAKIYKIKIFHDRFQNFIIGTPFYPIYIICYGLFILIILVSYVGCIFYQIDLSLYRDNYEYPSLLWVNQSAWNGIIDSSFGVQLLYAIYWSVGTASSCSYGDISGSAPPDTLYNIICLYFQGFLFGFYLSRIHSLPATTISEENEILDIFQKLEEHSNQIKNHGEIISLDLQFRMLCSIEYQYTRNKSLAEIEGILPDDYKMEIRNHIYKDFLRLDPAALWTSAHALRQSVSLRIAEVSAETAEQLFDYPSVGRCDLLFLKEGAAQSCLEIDHAQRFPRRIEEGSLLNVFSFFSGLQVEAATTVLTAYSLFYVLRRKDFRELLSPSEAVGFGALAEAAVAFDNALVAREPIGLYVEALRTSHSDVLLMDPVRHSAYVLAILDRRDSSQTQRRVWCSRKGSAVPRSVGLCRRGRVSVGVQCAEELPFQTDALLILDGD